MATSRFVRPDGTGDELVRLRGPSGFGSSRPVEAPRRKHTDSLSTVQHALRVIELVAARDGMTPKELAAELNLKLGTVYHLVNTLLDDGCVVRTTGGALHLGDRLPQILEQLDQRLDPYPELNDELVRLAVVTGTIAVVGHLIGRRVRIAAVQSFPGAAHQQLLRPGLQGPAHSMAIGKVLIARLPRRQVTELLEDWSLDLLTERTISRRDALAEAVEAAARRGFGLDLEEGVPGLTCIAAPILTPVGRPPAAIALGLTPDQFRVEGDRLIGLVVDAAWRSSRILGTVRSKVAVPPNGPPHVEPPAVA